MTNRNLLSKKIILGLATATLCYGPFGVVCAEEPVQQPTLDANALPTGEKVAYVDNVIVNGKEVAGTVNIDRINNNTMNITQDCNKAIIDWASFNVGRDATVNFIQTLNGKPNVAAMTLNRVSASGGMSEIAGHINSIGSFILVNPNGTMFYNGSEVNAAGVIVSTAQVDENSFKNGQLVFAQDKFDESGNPLNANITVNGTINASTNGSYLDGTNGLLATVKKNVDESVLNTTNIELATGFSFANNTIKLVADGDIIVGEKGSLQAITSTTISGDKTVGTEEFSVEGDSSTRLGSITLRADQNADDVNSDGVAAKVYLKNENASQIAAHSVGVYYNPDITKAGVNGAKVADIKDAAENQVVALSDANVKYTQKNYKNTTDYGSKVADKFTQFSRDTKGNVVETKDTKIVSESYNMLVNNLYQMEAIQDKTYGNMNGSYAQGTDFIASETANWNGKLGFKPIGTETKPFTGSFTGHGGSNTYSITDLTIKRPSEDNVGLFGVTGIYNANNGSDGTPIGNDGASFWSIDLVDAHITGKNFVGGIAGKATNKSKFSSISVRKSTPANNVITENNITGTDNVGGIVGGITNDGTNGVITDGGTIRFSKNNAQISGKDNVGGLAGSISGGAAGGTEEGSNNNIYKSYNNGVIISSGKSAGGLVGHVNSTLKTKDNQFATGDNNTVKDTTMKSAAVAIIESYSNGSVEGVTDVGGIVGTLKAGTIQYTYNTNESAALSSSSIVTTASVGAGTSEYGKVHGTENVGGIVGNMTGGTIDQSYNAGNVDGTTNVGGVVGSMSGGSIIKAYNADNNTVLYTSGDDTAKYYGFTVKNGDKIDSYTYNQKDQKWYKNDDKQTDVSNNLPAENERTYYNRLAYRDATVTGETNVGGIVGYMSKSADADKSEITQVYNAGQVKIKNGVTNTDSVGAFIGKYDGGTVNDSFYVTTANDVKVITDANGKVTTENDGTPITNQAKAVGNKDNSEFKDNITAKTLYQAQNTKDVTWTGGKNTANGWTIYTNSSTPLLNHFMKWININRQYEYDGTVHNLMTTDVANYYGGAFFNDGDGMNVYSPNYAVIDNYNASDWVIKSGSSSADTKHSSVYRYYNSTMWSPQHGYYTHNDARMIITPKTVTATITGTKTYGEDPVVGVKAADGSEPAISDPHSGNYSMTVTGFIGDDTADKVFTITEIDKVKYIGDSTHSEDNNQLGAGTYEATGTADKITTFKNPTFTNKDNNYNYNVTFKDTLKVNKADLLVNNIVGTKEYGDSITGSTAKYVYEFTQSENTSEDKDTTNGKIKSWDKEKISTNYSIDKKYVKSLEAEEKVYHNDTEQKDKLISEGSNVITENAGKYNLSNVEFADNIFTNYKVVYDTAKGSTGTMTITPATLKVTSEANKIYGQDAITSGVISDNAVDGKYNIKVDGLKAGDKLDSTSYDFSYSNDKAELGAGTYEFDTPIFTNGQINSKNYNISYNNTLIVNKARLDVGLVGTKTYGTENSTGIYKYYALNHNTDTSFNKEDNGKLKTFDYHNSNYNIPVKDEGLKEIPADKISSMEATENVKVNGADSNLKTIGKDADMLIYQDTDGKYAVYSYKLGNVVLDGKYIEDNYVLNYSNEGTMTITPANVVKEPTGRLVLPDNTVPTNVTVIEKPEDSPLPYVPQTNKINHPDVFDNIEDEHFAEQIQETAEDTKTGAAEESKKIRYGGYIPKEARDGIRFITVEDTGINVEDAKVEHTTITIEPDSLVEGSTEVVINGDAETSAE